MRALGAHKCDYKKCGALLSLLGPIYPLPRWWEHELLTAQSCIPHLHIALGHREILHPTLHSLLGAHNDRDAKLWLHSLNLGQL